MKPTDDCLVGEIHESMFTDPQLGNCNSRRYIPVLHSPYGQFSPSIQADVTASQQYIIKPTRLRLPAVSSSSQCIGDEITVHVLDHALDTQVIYAEPNRAHISHNSDDSNCPLPEDPTCDIPNALSSCSQGKLYQLPHQQPCSVICSASSYNHPNQSEEDSDEDFYLKNLLLDELHISEEDLITDSDDIKKTVGPVPRNYPNVINPECHGARNDESSNQLDSLPENGKNISPTYPSCADGNETVGLTDDKSTSQLITSSYNGPLADLDTDRVDHDDSVRNFVF